MTALEQAARNMAERLDKAFYVAALGPAPAPVSAPTTESADSKKAWMEANPSFKLWRQLSILSLIAWKDVGWVTDEGRFIPEGDSRFYGGLHLNSYGDTLFVVPSRAWKVGCEHSTIC